MLAVIAAAAVHVPINCCPSTVIKMLFQSCFWSIHVGNLTPASCHQVQIEFFESRRPHDYWHWHSLCLFSSKYLSLKL